MASKTGTRLPLAVHSLTCACSGLTEHAPMLAGPRSRLMVIVQNQLAAGNCSDGRNVAISLGSASRLHKLIYADYPNNP